MLDSSWVIDFERTGKGHVLFDFAELEVDILTRMLPQDGDISQQVLDKADAVVYVPTNGCMNLSATVNVVLYDRMTKSARGFNNNEHIRKNRDTNNRLKVKT